MINDQLTIYPVALELRGVSPISRYISPPLTANISINPSTSPQYFTMSDDDFMLESDNEDYEFDYEDDGEEESADVDIENRYYNAKQMKPTDPETAINEFLDVVKSEKEKGDWLVSCGEWVRCWGLMDVHRGFKGLKQAIKLEFKLKQHEKVYHLA